ncbi:MAG: type II toxin-antitoxin system VapB family antitoxin [Allosphingosinicella sp.]|uniref:type II toxin-antitoxin system VapB family antitoxin n=1 Tax=Allosphingosinicella sp. TaxID=2823234 RepID=UPI0039623D1F
MASLYIKDSETAALAGKVAAQLGTTKTEAVRQGLRTLERAGDVVKPEGSTADWLRAYRARKPLPDKQRMKVDKAFYDWLSGEEDVRDPGSK